MRILVTGANGQLGYELLRALTGEEVIPADQPDYELTDPQMGDKIAATHPNLVIHTAGYTDVDGCERDPETAFHVNARGTRRVAEGAAKANARLIYISTDYVFDGKKTEPYTERDPVNPLNVYGRSKLVGEEEALAVCPETLIIRTSWLYSVSGANFVKTILQLAAARPEIRVVNDQRGSPTYARDLAGAIAKLIRRDVRGLVHAGGAGECTWYEFAVAIVQEAGSDCKLVPISTAECGRLAARPAYSVLSTALLRQHGLSLLPWRTGLQRFIADQTALGSSTVRIN
jgi:dTDP-4-dehydrorhamnose reductase